MADDFGIKLCEILGVQSDKVLSINITVKPHDTRIYIETLSDNLDEVLTELKQYKLEAIP